MNKAERRRLTNKSLFENARGKATCYDVILCPETIHSVISRPVLAQSIIENYENDVSPKRLIVNDSQL